MLGCGKKDQVVDRVWKRIKLKFGKVQSKGRRLKKRGGLGSGSGPGLDVGC